jgi:hypothetical protein
MSTLKSKLEIIVARGVIPGLTIDTPSLFIIIVSDRLKP